jgi:hypothetical protein
MLNWFSRNFSVVFMQQAILVVEKRFAGNGKGLI